MNAWKIVLATMIIFGTGVVTGGLLVRNSHKVWLRPAIWQNAPQTQRPPAYGQPGLSGGSKLEFLRRAERDLRLSPDQKQQVDHVLRESQERIKKIMEGVSPAMRDEVQRAREEFRTVLTPQQRKRMDEMLKQQRSTRDTTRPGAREKGAEAPYREGQRRGSSTNSPSTPRE